jgi:hypothetical protein
MAPSAYVPQRPLDVQPPFQPVALYSPDAAGKATVELGSAVSTVHVKLAGVGSRLPDGSVARTSNVWLPSARPA